jgi:hypothetical protein
MPVSEPDLLHARLKHLGVHSESAHVVECSFGACSWCSFRKVVAHDEGVAHICSALAAHSSSAVIGSPGAVQTLGMLQVPAGQLDAHMARSELELARVANCLYLLAAAHDVSYGASASAHCACKVIRRQRGLTRQPMQVGQRDRHGESLLSETTIVATPQCLTPLLNEDSTFSSVALLTIEVLVTVVNQLHLEAQLVQIVFKHIGALTAGD